MVWSAGMGRGVPPAVLRRAVGLLWLSIVACVAGLALLRAGLGTPGVVDVDAGAGPAVQVRALSPWQWGMVGAGLVWTCGWLVVALRAAGAVQSRGEGAGPGASQEPGE